MLNSKDISKLALCIDGLPAAAHAVSAASASDRVLGCVLSLHRKWDAFAVPRLTEFRKNHPNVNTLLDLCQLVARCGGPERFYDTELNYRYPQAAEMFGRVLDYLTRETARYPGGTEMERCRNWATSVSVDGYRGIWKGSNIPLFGIAGWQYLRMLFGADTCKPDIAVKEFVEDCLGRWLSDHLVVALMERAAPMASALKSFPQPVPEADHRIWQQYNRRKNQNKRASRRSGSCRTFRRADTQRS